jgi:N-acetylmuramoyl-L-alanine amidase
MSYKPFRFHRFKTKYRLVNLTRFAAIVLVFLFAVTAVLIIIAKNSDPPSDQGAVVVTPTVMPTPEPQHEPPNVEVPEGKTMAPLLVVIDAGHGGRDPGTISPYDDDFFEKDITLYIAKKVNGYLSDKGIKAVMTREDDDHLSDVIKEDLLARCEVGNKNDASLFVSIHVNAYDLKYKGAANVNGMEVYYYNKKATYTDFTEERFAQIIGDEIVKTTGIKFNGIKSSPLSVLRNTEMPAVLVETGYITGKVDSALLASDDFKDKTARGIADGIEKTIQEIGAFKADDEMYVFKEAGE